MQQQAYLQKSFFGDNFIVKSGQSIELQPQLQDEWGNQLDLSNAGTLSWQWNPEQSLLAGFT